MIHINISCIECGTTHSIPVPEEGYKRFKAGEHIQTAMPSVSADLREMFISRICPVCWDKMFKDPDEEDDV